LPHPSTTRAYHSVNINELKGARHSHMGRTGLSGQFLPCLSYILCRSSMTGLRCLAALLTAAGPMPCHLEIKLRPMSVTPTLKKQTTAYGCRNAGNRLRKFPACTTSSVKCMLRCVQFSSRPTARRIASTTDETKKVHRLTDRSPYEHAVARPADNLKHLRKSGDGNPFCSAIHH